MDIDVSSSPGGLRYRLSAAPDDPEEFGQALNSARRFRRTGATFEVRLPPSFRELHPDTHAEALWLALRPMVGSTLALPFGVTPACAERLARTYDLDLPRQDATLAPRATGRRPALLFSGGVDSLAAALVMPRETAILFLDRTPHFPPGQDERSQEILIDPAAARRLARALGRDGHDVHIVATDHDHLYAPYPFYHSAEFHLPALYLADSLGIGTVASGDVLCALAFGGYHDGRDEWRFRPEGLRPRGAASPSNPAEARGAPDPARDLPAFGLGYHMPLLGLTEVGTARIVYESAFRGRATSCYFPSTSNYCLRCDKCFKKLLLDYVLGDREVPAALVEHFLQAPELERIFARPFFDWHHIWYYIFQRIRCAHPLALELRRQAREGPDLTLFEKWYPIDEGSLPADGRDELLTNIHRRVPAMTSAERRTMETLSVPPLHVPPDLLQRAARAAASAPDASGPDTEPAWCRPFDGPLPLPELAHRLRLLLAAAAELGLVAPGPASVAVEGGDPYVRVAIDAAARVVLDLVPHVAEPRVPGWEVLPHPPEGGDGDAWVRIVRIVAAWLDRRCHDDGQYDAERLRASVQPSPLLRRVERAAFVAGRGPTAPLRATWPTRTGHGAVHVGLHGADDLLELTLAEREPGGRCFRATERTAVSHSPATPVDTPARKAALRRLLACLERAESAAPDRGER